MEFKDITPIMILGEARKIAPGKVLVQVSASDGLRMSSVADLALVALGGDRKSVGAGYVVCRTHPVSVDRSMRLLADVVRLKEGVAGEALWYGCIFEVSTDGLPDGVEAVALVGDDLDALSGDLVVTVEDGRSDPHVFPIKLVHSHRSAVLATVYRHSSSWKPRAASLAFNSDRTAIAAELGMKEAWPKAVASGEKAADRPIGGGREKPAAGRSPSSHAFGSFTAVPVSPPNSSDTAGDTAPLPLDLARLSALERDTAAVSRLLSDIFTDTGTPVPRIETKKGPEKLDESHLAILKAVMAARSMTPSEFEQTAREHGQMASGAEATVNDWSFDVVGDLAIISDGETFTFNEDLRRSIESVY